MNENSRYKIFCIVITIIFLISIELLCRFYYVIKNVNINYLLYGIQMPQKVVENNREVSTKDYYITDSRMRYRKVKYFNPKGRIIVIGGSTTYGHHLKDNETYPYYLESMTGVEVINMGYQGAKLSDFLKIKQEIINLNPNTLIIHAGWNETVNAIKISQLEIVSNKYVLWLKDHCLFFAVLKEKIALICHNHAEYAWYNLNKNRIKTYADLNNECFDEYKKDLIAFIDCFQSHNIKIIVIKYPYMLYHNKPTEYEATLSTYFWKDVVNRVFQIIDEVACEKNIQIIDCSTLSNKLEYFTDVMHMTKEGYYKLAKIIRVNLWMKTPDIS